MSALSDAKRAMRPGAVFDVTNHYITRQDHPCYGTNRRTVAKANSASFYWDGAQWGTPWPKAAQVQADADGTIRMYGGGAGQAAADLFLTLVPVQPGR